MYSLITAPSTNSSLLILGIFFNTNFCALLSSSVSSNRIYEENKNNDKIINGFDALSMVVPSEGSKLNKKYIEKIKNYADENKIELEDYVLTHEINTTAYADKQHEYKEIYIKIKK